MQPIIHIGYPKTSTTWFQKNFYPMVRNTDFIPREEIFSKILRVNAFTFDPISTREYFIDKYKDKDFITICEEEILVDQRNNGIRVKEMANRIYAVFPEASIVIFLRNQLDMMASRYSQHLKAGGNYRATKYLFRKNIRDRSLSNDFSLFEYDKIIQLYQDLFGINNVFIYLYEEFQENNIEFLTSFSKQHLLKYDLKHFILKHENIRLRVGIIPVIKFINIFTRKKYSYKYYLIHIPFWFEASRLIIEFLNQFKIFGRVAPTEKLLGKANINFLIYSNLDSSLSSSHNPFPNGVWKS